MWDTHGANLCSRWLPFPHAHAVEEQILKICASLRHSVREEYLRSHIGIRLEDEVLMSAMDSRPLRPGQVAACLQTRCRIAVLPHEVFPSLQQAATEKATKVEFQFVALPVFEQSVNAAAAFGVACPRAPPTWADILSMARLATFAHAAVWSLWSAKRAAQECDDHTWLRHLQEDLSLPTSTPSGKQVGQWSSPSP